MKDNKENEAELLIYMSPEGKSVDPVDYLYGVWTSDSLGAVWYKVLGYFILDNVPAFFPDLVRDDACVAIEKSAAADGIVMRSSYVKDIRAADVFASRFWSDSRYPGFLMDDIVHQAFRDVLASGRLIKGTLRLRVTPVLKHDAERLELKLVWLEAVVPGTAP